MNYSEDHFNYYIRSTYNLDSILRDTFNRKEGSYVSESNVLIIKVLNSCYENEGDTNMFLIEFIENHILQCESRLLTAKKYKEQLSKEDFQYDWKLLVENRHISYLISKINSLKIWVNEKSEMNLQQLVDQEGNLKLFDSKKEKIESNLLNFGFFELQKVKTLSYEGKQELIKLIAVNDNLTQMDSISYSVAMFDYLGFFIYLEEKHFSYNKRKMQLEISKWFESDKDGRRIRGLINSLSKNAEKYNSYKFKAKVIEDYQKIK